jgi:hypothetical protein
MQMTTGVSQGYLCVHCCRTASAGTAGEHILYYCHRYHQQ